MNILYLGSETGTCAQRADALRRLGHRVRSIDPRALVPSGWMTEAYIYKIGGVPLSSIVRRAVVNMTAHDAHDLVWVDGGELIDAGLLRILQNRFGRIVNYNIDDPFGHRDGNRWRLYFSSIELYDLIVVMREVNVAEAYAHGARRVLRVLRSADEIVHQAQTMTPDEIAKFHSDVLFIGTWMPERGPLIGSLIEAGLPLTIYGERWHKAKQWKVIRRAWKGPGIHDQAYSKYLQSAAICLGLLSKGNRDLHTTRSFEIPAVGSLLMAERTPEHEMLFVDGTEAVFWSDADDCIKKCRWLLEDASTRERIADAGRARCISSGYFNENVLRQILDSLAGFETSIR